MSQGALAPRGSQPGFFYLNDYFLLPEGYSDGASFLAAMHSAQAPVTLRAVVLREDSDAGFDAYERGVCIAPYFIADYLKAPEELTIAHPGEVYPVPVTLLTQKEYNVRLRRQVTANCPGCRAYGGLTEEDATLSGHFEEITLDGFCPYRWETRKPPRNFDNALENFGYAWRRYGYADMSADDLLRNIKEDLWLSYTSGALIDDQNGRTLALYSKTTSLIHTALTDLWATCVSKIWEESYHIRFNKRADISEAAVMALLTPQKLTATRKELAKYGVKIAVMEYAAQGDESVSLLFHALEAEGSAWVLHAESGKILCLLTGDHSVMRLRCASPLLETYDAIVTLYDALKTLQYKISFSMEKLAQDAVQPPEDKAQALSRKLLKAEAGRVLKRDQVEQLFSYVSGRLSKDGCDHTLRFTEAWLKGTQPPEVYAAAIEEIRGMGGLCDCELLMNCYADYELT